MAPIKDAFRDLANTLLPFGRNAPTPKPADETKPNTGRPYGQPGRVNIGGFVQEDELNASLAGNVGLKKYDEIYRSDPDVRRNVLAIWSPIETATISVDPHGGDNATPDDLKAAALVEWALQSHMTPNLRGHLHQLGPVLIRSGFCPFEQLWEQADWDYVVPSETKPPPEPGEGPAKPEEPKIETTSVTVPRKLDMRLPRTIWRFFQDDDANLVGAEQFLPNAANIFIPASELVYYRVQIEGDNWRGTSLLRQAFKPWYYKDRLERLDAIGQERKAVGLPIIYPPQAAPGETREEVEKVFAAVHTNEVGYVMMPGPKAGTGGLDASEGWNVEVITFDSSSGDTIQASIDSHGRKLAGAFLADFLELGHHQVGARATAQVQEDPFLTAVEALGAQILEPLNDLAARIALINFPDLKGTPKLKMSIHDVASLSEIAQYVAQLIQADAMIPDPELEDYLRERGDLPSANPEIRRQHEEAQAAGRQQAMEPETPGEQENGEGPEGTAKGLNKSQERKPAEPENPRKNGKKELDQSGRWWDNMLSQGKLVDALDGARTEVQQAASPAAYKLARTMVARGRTGRKLVATPPADLVDALHGQFTKLAAIGHETVRDELTRQRRALGTEAKQFATAPATDAVLAARVRKRAKVAAQHVTNEVARAVERGTVNGTDGLALQRAAERAAEGSLRVEAVANASQAVNEGRNLAAREAPDVVGGILTSVLDQNTCDECQGADDGTIRELDDPALEVPVPNCAGGDRCRCMVTYVLSEDPSAIGAEEG